MATLAELQDAREALVASRLRGIREVRDSSGEAVVYKSDSEMAAALAAVDREIAALTAGRPASVIRFSTSKGL